MFIFYVTRIIWCELYDMCMMWIIWIYDCRECFDVIQSLDIHLITMNGRGKFVCNWRPDDGNKYMWERSGIYELSRPKPYIDGKQTIQHIFPCTFRRSPCIYSTSLGLTRLRTPILPMYLYMVPSSHLQASIYTCIPMVPTGLDPCENE
jgi:hypothetical protein